MEASRYRLLGEARIEGGCTRLSRLSTSNRPVVGSEEETSPVVIEAMKSREKKKKQRQNENKWFFHLDYTASIEPCIGH
jgi:hypothetical protein